MTFHTITPAPLTIEGIAREFMIRQVDGSTPRNAVIWFHGGSMTMDRMMGNVRADPWRIDIFPQALRSYGDLPGSPPGPTWGLPGQPDEDLLPNNMHPTPKDGALRTSKFADLKFACELINYIEATYTDIEYIRLAGFSKGGSLVWGCYAFNNAYNLPDMAWAEPLSRVRGYFLCHYGSPMIGTEPFPAAPAPLDGFGWNIIDGIDLGWVNSTSSATRALGTGTPSGIVRWSDVGAAQIIRPTLFWHGSQRADRLPLRRGHVKSWDNSSADLLELHRALRWDNTIPDTHPITGWHLHKFRPAVNSFVSSNKDDLRTEYPNYIFPPNAPGAAGKVRVRHALRDPAVPVPPAPGSVPRVTAALRENEVVGGGHDFTKDLTPILPPEIWDESREATDFFIAHP